MNKHHPFHTTSPKKIAKNNYGLQNLIFKVLDKVNKDYSNEFYKMHVHKEMFVDSIVSTIELTITSFLWSFKPQKPTSKGTTRFSCKFITNVLCRPCSYRLCL
jgi:CRISPR/Cas system endoribonuclease Cas6 (RAMP superfamily)